MVILTFTDKGKYRYVKVCIMTSTFKEPLWWKKLLSFLSNKRVQDKIYMGIDAKIAHTKYSEIKSAKHCKNLIYQERLSLQKKLKKKYRGKISYLWVI